MIAPDLVQYNPPPKAAELFMKVKLVYGMLTIPEYSPPPEPEATLL